MQTIPEMYGFKVKGLLNIDPIETMKRVFFSIAEQGCWTTDVHIGPIYKIQYKNLS